jgi:phage terminase Nu1 subunit (DNA packaging protein)
LLVKYLDVHENLVEGDLLIKEQQSVQDLKNAGDEEIVVKEKTCKYIFYFNFRLRN